MAVLVTGSNNLRTLTMYGSAGRLGVYCTACHHRATLTPDLLGAHSGNMRSIHDIRFKCSGCGVRGTGAAEFVTYILADDHDVSDFIAGVTSERDQRLSG